jgi:hypothetical protein
MKYSSSFLLFPAFVLTLLITNTGCRLAGKHADATVVNSEQPTILKDTTITMPDTAVAQ